GHLIGEYDGSGSLIEETVWFGDIPVAAIQPNRSTVAVDYGHTDQLNTPRQGTRPSGKPPKGAWVSGPFGTEAGKHNPAGEGAFGYNLRFPGQIFMGPAGLHQNYMRDYDSATGRYVEADPIGLNGGINAYRYSYNDPLEYFDDFGLEPCFQLVCIPGF